MSLVVERESSGVVHADAVVRGLRRGARYRLVRAARAGGPPVTVHEFTAAGASHRRSVPLAPDRSAYYRCEVVE